MSKPVGKFYKNMCKPKLITYSWEQELKRPENNSFAVPFMHLKLKRKRKENYTQVGKGKAGIGLEHS